MVVILVKLNTAPLPDNEHSEKEKENLTFYTTLRQLCKGCNIGDVEYCPPGQTMTIVVTCGPSAKLASRAMD